MTLGKGSHGGQPEHKNYIAELVANALKEGKTPQYGKGWGKNQKKYSDHVAGKANSAIEHDKVSINEILSKITKSQELDGKAAFPAVTAIAGSTAFS